MAQGVEDLVGRATELGLLGGALAEVERSRPVAVALLGEPGIGKTRLLAELGERADERGALVLTGSASEFERDLPFWVFVDALDEYVQSVEPHRLAGLDAGSDARPRAARRWRATGAAGCSQAERYRTHRAVRGADGGPRAAQAARAAARRPALGRLRARSSCSAGCCAARRPGRC